LEEQEKIIESEDAEGGWVDTHHFANLNEQVLEMTLSSGDKKCDKTNSNVVNKSVGDEDEDEDDDEPEDMESYANKMDEMLETDPVFV
jgi:ubiquitin-like-conjugating enzyme ATG3